MSRPSGSDTIPSRSKKSELAHFREFDRRHRNAVEKWRLRRQANCKGEISTPALYFHENEEKKTIVNEMIETNELFNPGGLSAVPAQCLEACSGDEISLLTEVCTEYICDKAGATPGCSNFERDGTKVFMTFNINGVGGHSVQFQLYDSAAPLACQNFTSLCAGDRVIKLHLFLCLVIIKSSLGSMCQIWR